MTQIIQIALIDRFASAIPDEDVDSIGLHPDVKINRSFGA